MADVSPTRLFVWFIGLLLVLGSVYVLYATTDLRNLVPEGAVIAAILLILGIAVMGIASQFDSTSRPRRTTTYDEVPPGDARRGPPPEDRRYREERFDDERY